MTRLASSLRRLALKSDHRTFMHAALVKKGGAIVSSGYNRGVVHAEAMALRLAFGNGNTLVSIRVTRGGQISNAKPCAACMKLAAESGIKKIIYSDDKRQLVTMRIRM